MSLKLLLLQYKILAFVVTWMKSLPWCLLTLVLLLQLVQQQQQQPPTELISDKETLRRRVIFVKNRPSTEISK
jgi:uncharacterized membrane protein